MTREMYLKKLGKEIKNFPTDEKRISWTITRSIYKK